MMISPQYYVETNVKDKSCEEILKIIKKLHREMSSLKKHAELDNSEIISHPSYQVRIDMTRQYIEHSKKYLIEQGGVYTPNKLELKSQQFDNDLKHVNCIEIEYGGFCGGSEIRTLKKWDNLIIVERKFYNGACDDGKSLYNDLTWSELLDMLSDLHIGEWEKTYDDPLILDGTQWSLDLEYDQDIKKRHYYGSNMFPYNFDDFLSIMEMN